MTEPSPSTLANEFAAALDWWRDAGVDHDFADDVTDWLVAPEAQSAQQEHQPKPKKKAEPAPPPPPKKIGGAREDWPAELAAFQQWLVSSEELDGGGAFPPIAPRGSAGAELMVILPEPEENDSDDLLAGPQGRLLAGIMQAAAISDDDIYLATVLRRHTPMPDWQALRSAGIGEVLSHHIALAAPKRILAFGRNIPPLLGNDTAQGTVILPNFNHEGGSIPAMGVGSLAELLRSAGRRQRFWQRWLEWTDS
ncbi:hypothetical protein [Pontixanthobacter sp. CEM42]|uniref:hypothetical protein n=1 Tax=Pontixanthobacter sp. CEM42 TaxID=2792077 RepID=UPI001ADED566|nr:hypothetical protein [Pontixanthobacter sp. CEM42]